MKKVWLHKRTAGLLIAEECDGGFILSFKKLRILVGPGANQFFFDLGPL
jgi:hypothetical protein